MKRQSKRLIGWVASGLSVALLVGLAVVASGFYASEAPREEPSVWVTRAAGQYARVNTETGEIDTVRRIDGPGGIVQSGQQSVLLGQTGARAWVIDPASPQDIESDDEQAAGVFEVPSGTELTLLAGQTLLHHTEGGEVVLADAATGTLRGTVGVHADAAAMDATGLIALYSAASREVTWFDAEAGQIARSASVVPEEVVAGENPQLAIVDGDWVLLNPESGEVWREGSERASVLELVGRSLLQASAVGVADGAVFVADESGLWRVGADGTVERVVETAGVPAQPTPFGDDLGAAWLGSSTGAMWTWSGGEAALAFDQSVEPTGELEPVLFANGSRAVVGDRRSGMLWSVPDGTVIPLEQWSLVDPPKQQSGDVIAQDVTQQEPPVAVDDDFGVRAGEPTLLAVMLNDFDPNRKDSLTIVAEGLAEGLDPDFGTVSLLSNSQGLLIRPSEAATGSTSFTYRITDGTSISEAATVSLHVAPAEVNSAPQWCPTDGCQRLWPAPEMTPGGTLVLPLIEGWVDPEGDPIMLSSATVVSGDLLRALVTAEGQLAVRHTDPDAADSEAIVRVTVADDLGARTERDLRISIRAGATMELAPIASTVKVGESTVLRPLARVSGGSGSYRLVDATVQQGALSAEVNQGSGTINVTASQPGVASLAFTVRDVVTEQEIAGVIRVTSVEERNPLAVPPLRAFVRPFTDTTVEVLAAVSNSSGRALSVRSASVRDGQLRADVIEHARVRVSGSTSEGLPGRIGSADIVVAEGNETTTARLTVFQTSTMAGSAIAVADSATVRAGSVVDISALDNDVAPAGERLVLHPIVVGSGAEGELVFASGNVLRYLAPSTPGIYQISYSTYGAGNPDQLDTATVQITVLPAEGNRAPQPPTLTVRVAPGEQATVTVPLSGIDPDGDRVRLVETQSPEDPQVTASMLPRSGVVQISASTSAERGVRTGWYVVRDDSGGEARGALRIIVTDPDAGGGAPVVYSDYVRIAIDSTEPALVRPLDNDLDPSGGSLELVSVVPNVPGDADSYEYQALLERLDLSQMRAGIVRVTGDTLGTASFRYTVRSTTTSSTADGLIVVQVSEKVGEQAPVVSDTVLSVRDRTEFSLSGVDVVSDRVRWSGGNVASLELSLWGNAALRYSVNGTRIIGQYRAAGDLVPFKLSGTDFSGNPVESFGFLVVPPLDELRLSLKSGLDPLTVNEGESIEADLAQLLDLGPNDTILVDRGGFSVQRGQASCSPAGSTGLRYIAGRNAPWSDTCTVRVRLAEQHTYTAVSVPIRIVPDDPVAELYPLTRTIAPGAAENIDLLEMLGWQADREGNVQSIRFGVSGEGSSFAIGTLQGTVLPVHARADAVPGAQDSLTVTISGSGQNSRATLTLRAGESAQDTPRGAAVALNCTVGTTCRTSLVGQAGEHDPFAGAPGAGLKLVSIDPGTCAAFGEFTVQENRAVFSWTDQRGPGGECATTFTVRDAQNRVGTGQLTLSMLGYPVAPAQIEQAAFTDHSITLRVVLGDALNAQPAPDEVRIYSRGTQVPAICGAPAGVVLCEVNDLTLGEQINYAARVVNAVGESSSGPSVSAWAFREPAAPTVTSVQQVSAESATSGTVRFAMTTSDPSARGFEVRTNGAVRGTLLDVTSGTLDIAGINVGEGIAYQVVTVSKFPRPGGGSNTSTGTGGTVTVGGKPTLLEPGFEISADLSTVTVTVDASSNFGGALEYGAMEGDVCVVSTNSAVFTFAAQPEGSTMRFTVCVRNDWGDTAPVTRDLLIEGATP